MKIISLHSILIKNLCNPLIVSAEWRRRCWTRIRDKDKGRKGEKKVNFVIIYWEWRRLIAWLASFNACCSYDDDAQTERLSWVWQALWCLFKHKTVGSCFRASSFPPPSPSSSFFGLIEYRLFILFLSHHLLVPASHWETEDMEGIKVWQRSRIHVNRQWDRKRLGFVVVTDFLSLSSRKETTMNQKLGIKFEISSLLVFFL